MRSILAFLLASIPLVASAQTGDPNLYPWLPKRGGAMTGAIQVAPFANGSEPATCNAANAGKLIYSTTSTALRLCDGSSWGNVGGSAGAITGTLTATRVPFASGASTVTDAAGFTFAASVLTVPSLLDSGLTASRLVASDASKNLVSTITSANLLASISDPTGTGVAVFNISPSITTSMTTGSSTFALVNTNATTVNFAGAATTLNMGASGGTTTITGGLVVTSGGTIRGAGTSSTLIGDGGSTAAGQYAVVIGNASLGNVVDAVVIGRAAQVSGTSGGVAIGTGPTASGERSIAIGNAVTSSAQYGVAFGYTAQATGQSAVAVGAGSLASGSYSIVLGESSSAASNAGSIILGYNLTTTSARQLLIGGNSATAYIDDVYIGKGVTHATPTNLKLNPTGGSGTDIAGASLTLAGGKGTGAGAGGSVLIQTAAAGSTGTTLSSLTTRLTVNSSGEVAVAAAAGLVLSTSSSPASNAACTAGAITWDASFVYVCTSSGVWKRAALTGGY